MKNIDKEQVYINLNSKYSVELNTHIYVEDVGEVYCKDERITDKVNKIKVYSGQDTEMYGYITATDIIAKIMNHVENIDINLLGSSEILLEVKGKEDTNVFLNILKISIVCLIIFFGSALTFIYFFEDVNMKDAIEKIYYIITGSNVSNPKIMTIPFSIGIGLGIFAFFNRIFSFSKRRRQEPGPLELELYLYDKNLEDNIMNDINKDNS